MKLNLISDFNLELLKRFIESKSIKLIDKVNTIPYGQFYQSIFTFKEDKNSVNFVWTFPENHIQSFKKALNGEEINIEDVEKEVNEFANLIINLSQDCKYIFIPSWVKLFHYRSYGILDWKIEFGINRLIAQMNLRLAVKFENIPNIFIIDSNEWELNSSANSNPKLWYLTKVPFNKDVFSKVCNSIMNSLKALEEQSKKLIIVDLDNTLWGGIIGDVDFSGINIGGHNHIGEAYKDFQNALLALYNQGIMLAIASKNDEEIAIKAFDKNTEMVLKRKHFVAWEINWEDKYKNIVKMARELNIGLDSIVFIDDNPVEREAVSTMLPEVYVPDWSIEPTSFSVTLNKMTCFDKTFITKDDRKRTQSYKENKLRKESQNSLKNKNEWLKQLNTIVNVNKLNSTNISRITQIFNKTNQFNLTTRRLTEIEIQEFYSNKENDLITIEVEDKFGNLGLVGIIGFSFNDKKNLFINDLILSCRAMGRGVEETMLFIINNVMEKRKSNYLELNYVKSIKNKPILNFLKSSTLDSENNIKFYSTGKINFQLPSYITLNSKL